MTARTVLHSNGRARRVVLKQPPHFRTGHIDAPAADHTARAADRAIRESQFECLDRAMHLRRFA